MISEHFFLLNQILKFVLINLRSFYSQVTSERKAADSAAGNMNYVQVEAAFPVTLSRDSES